MKTKTLLLFISALLAIINLGISVIIESVVVGGVISSLIGTYLQRCKFYECCTDEYIPRNTYELKRNLTENLYGQKIARQMVYSAISSHINHHNPRKPLVLSFHGLPGSGKNYVVQMIANALYKFGEKSNFYHFFNGRGDFPENEKVALYKLELQSKVRNALSTCERSIFVFDEVDKMPVGILDALVPFIDYTSYSGREKSKSIFIFLSNTGGKQILDRMIELWVTGKDRDDVTLQDFERLIAFGAFNEAGGLHKSAAIKSNLIDHHIPFLPLEQKHVELCVKDAFRHFGVPNPSDKDIEEVMSHVIYGPKPHNLYSTGGCKRLDYKVSSIINKEDF